MEKCSSILPAANSPAVTVRQFPCNGEKERQLFARSFRIRARTRTLCIACLAICLNTLFPANGWTFQEPVSLVSLIAVPEKYDGKLVRLTGYALVRV